MNGPASRISVDDHILRLREMLRPVIAALGHQTLRIDDPQICGRLAAEDIAAPHPLPGFDNSQMDGYAVRSADLHQQQSLPGTSARLPYTGVVPAGTAAPELPEGSAMAIMTGAPVPSGADVVIPVEKVRNGFAPLEASTDFTVDFESLTPEDLAPGRFIRVAGSDLSAGQVLVRTGEVLTPARLAVLAAAGIATLRVRRVLRTLIVSTGAELRAPEEVSPHRPLGAGEIFDANTALLSAVCAGNGHHVTAATISTDDTDVFADRFHAAVVQATPDLVITAGGISAGAYEVVRQSLSPHGLQVGSVAQQPGGPQAWGLLCADDHRYALIGLPGNPVSCAVSLETLVRPALHAEDPSCPPPRHIQVTLQGGSLSSPPGIRQYRRVTLDRDTAGQLTATPIGGPSSHLIGHLAASDALLQIPEQVTELAAGTVCGAVVLPGSHIPEPLPARAPHRE